MSDQQTHEDQQDSRNVNTGVVLYRDSRERLTGASVVALEIKDDGSVGGPVPVALTDEDGKFTWEKPDGNWKIEVRHPKTTPTSFMWDVSKPRQEFLVEAISDKVGQHFLLGLFGSLVVVVFLYIFLHNNLTRAAGPLSVGLLEEIDSVLEGIKDQKTWYTDFNEDLQKLAPDSLKETFKATVLSSLSVDSMADNLKAWGIDDTMTTPLLQNLSTRKMQDSVLASQMLQIDASLMAVLKPAELLTEADKDALIAGSHASLAALRSKDFSAADKALTKVRSDVKCPKWPGFIPWERGPWKYLEILFWAMGGVLCFKIIRVGWYVYKRRFTNTGSWMHIAHIFAVPLIVLVAMILLSLVSLEFNLEGGQSVTVDLSKPNLLRAFSFILGLAPWGVWDFVRAQGRRITGDSKGE